MRLTNPMFCGKTPHEIWHDRKPDVSHLRVWGCLHSLCSHSEGQKGEIGVTHGKVYIYWLS